MIVAIGSVNKSKIKGIRKAYLKFFADVEFKSLKASSNVPRQPFGLDMIFKGAISRAVNAIRVTNADHGVGVEAGIYSVNDRWFDVQVVAIVDRNGWFTYGLSPSFEIPLFIVEKIVKGEADELESVVDEIYGTRNIGEKGGFISLLTGNTVLRRDLTYYGTIMALIPRLNTNLKLYTKTIN
ncbi:MAG: inosine/xanthosine triphosphatase [Candidatus Methanomethylicia archaeon]